MKHTNWYDIRANWVNGNLKAAKEQLINQPKSAILATIKEAMDTASDYYSADSGTFSGDLRDLHELLAYIVRTS